MKRRTFLRTVAGLAAGTAFPRFAIGTPGKSANSKLNVAFIGSGGWIARQPYQQGCSEENLVAFIKALRKDFNAPAAKFVLATLGEATKGSTGNGGKVLDAQLAVDGTSGKYPDFKGNVATVYANPLSKGGSGNGHYGGNAETYMEVGEAMGKAMVELLKN